MAFSFELRLAVSAGPLAAVSTGPEQAGMKRVCLCIGASAFWSNRALHEIERFSERPNFVE